MQSVDVVLADGTRVQFGAGGSAQARGREIEARVREIVLANADEIARKYPKTWRTVSGYALNKLDPEKLNLAHLFAGAEGTLGTVVEATLGLVALPTMTRMALVHYDDMRAALVDVPYILEVAPSAVE